MNAHKGMGFDRVRVVISDRLILGEKNHLMLGAYAFGRWNRRKYSSVQHEETLWRSSSGFFDGIWGRGIPVLDLIHQKPDIRHFHGGFIRLGDNSKSWDSGGTQKEFTYCAFVFEGEKES